MEAKGGHLKIEAKGASQRRKLEGENWRHTPNAEVGSASGRRKRKVQSNHGGMLKTKVRGKNQKEEIRGASQRWKPKGEANGSKKSTEIVTKKPKHREQIIPAMECCPGA